MNDEAINSNTPGSEVPYEAMTSKELLAHIDSMRAARAAGEDSDFEFEERTPSEMELAAAIERGEKGWSRWDVLALGMDNTLITEMGKRIMDYGMTIGSRVLREIGADVALSSSKFEREAKDDEDFLLWAAMERARYRAVSLGIDRLSGHVGELRVLTFDDEKRFPIFRTLGDALVGFGEYDLHGVPPREPYSSFEGYVADGVQEVDAVSDEAGLSLWKEHCVKHGRLLMSDDDLDVAEGLRWLSSNFSDLWD